MDKWTIRHLVLISEQLTVLSGGTIKSVIHESDSESYGTILVRFGEVTATSRTASDGREFTVNSLVMRGDGSITENRHNDPQKLGSVADMKAYEAAKEMLDLIRSRWVGPNIPVSDPFEGGWM